MSISGCLMRVIMIEANMSSCKPNPITLHAHYLSSAEPSLIHFQVLLIERSIAFSALLI